MNDTPSLETLIEKMRSLKLPGMARTVEEILDRSTAENLTSIALLNMLLDEERASRLQNVVKRRIHEAKFPELNSIDGFDFDFHLSRKHIRSRYLSLHNLSFLVSGINPLFVGTPGAGKTFLARALALKACQERKRVVFTSAARMLNELHGAELHGSLEKSLRRYIRAELLVIDDFATLAMDPAQAKLAFQVISERYDHRRSTCITTNRPFKEWTKVFPDALNAQVIAERLIERSEHFLLDGGYRTKL